MSKLFNVSFETNTGTIYLKTMVAKDFSSAEQDAKRYSKANFWNARTTKIQEVMDIDIHYKS